MSELTPEDSAFIAEMAAIEVEAMESIKGFAQRFRESAEAFAKQVEDRINGTSEDTTDEAEIRATVVGAEAEEVVE